MLRNKTVVGSSEQTRDLLQQQHQYNSVATMPLGFRSVVGIAFVSTLAIFVSWLEFSFLRLDIANNERSIWSQTIPNIAASSFDWDGVRPLNVAFLSWGSRGDHQPNVALGLELARRGHNVTVMGLEKYRPVIEKHAPRIRFAPLQDDYLWSLGEQFHRGDGSSDEQADFLRLTKAYAVNTSRQLVPQYMSVGQYADVLFGNHAAMITLHHVTVVEKLQKPLFLTTHDLTLPTAAYSFTPDVTRVADFGKRWNVFNHRMFGVLFGIVMTFGPTSEWRRYRTELGLRTPWPFMELFSPTRMADFPVFYTADPILWKPPSDRPRHWYSTGYFVTKDEELPVSRQTVELEEWIEMRREQNLDNPRRLFYFGQGSFSHHDRAAYTEILLDSSEKLHLDVVALSSTVDTASPLPPHIRVEDDVDQERLFPMCDVVSHHGGAGSASQCIRGGKPGVGLPSMPSQVQTWQWCICVAF